MITVLLSLKHSILIVAILKTVLRHYAPYFFTSFFAFINTLVLLIFKSFIYNLRVLKF